MTDADVPSPDEPAEPTPRNPLIEALIASSYGVTDDPLSGSNPGVRVPVENLYDLLAHLRSEPSLAFNCLLSHTAVDRPADGTIELLYVLQSLSTGQRLLVTCPVNRDNASAPTVCGLWPIAEWQEREVFDLFGVTYEKHPDLRRVFLDDDWRGYPLRKDYQDDFMLTPDEPKQ